METESAAAHASRRAGSRLRPFLRPGLWSASRTLRAPPGETACAGHLLDRDRGHGGGGVASGLQTLTPAGACCQVTRPMVCPADHEQAKVAFTIGPAQPQRGLAPRVRGQTRRPGRDSLGEHGSRSPRPTWRVAPGLACAYLRELGAQAEIIGDRGTAPRTRAPHPGSRVSDGDHLQPPRRATGRRPKDEGWRTRPFALERHRRPLPRPRRHRRQGAGPGRALRRSTGLGSGGEAQLPVSLGVRGGDGQPQLRGGAGRPGQGAAGPAAHGFHRGFRHHLAVGEPARHPLRPARAARLRGAVADWRQGRALGYHGRRGPQSRGRAVRARRRVLRRQALERSEFRASTTASASRRRANAGISRARASHARISKRRTVCAVCASPTMPVCARPS